MIDSKQALRRRLRDRLSQISATRAEEAGQRIASQLAVWPGLAEAPQLCAFASLAGEVSTRPLLELARRIGRPFLLPRMRGQDLEYAPIEGWDELVAGRHGVREPPGSRAAAGVQRGAVVCVPGLAFDRSGGRLGRGAGYYDRKLGRLRAESPETLFLGLGFREQIVRRVPMTADDVFLDGVVTDAEWIWAAAETDPSG